jgi:hypothetical protein
MCIVHRKEDLLAWALGCPKPFRAAPQCAPPPPTPFAAARGGRVCACEDSRFSLSFLHVLDCEQRPSCSLHAPRAAATAG